MRCLGTKKWRITPSVLLVWLSIMLASTLFCSHEQTSVLVVQALPEEEEDGNAATTVQPPEEKAADNLQEEDEDESVEGEEEEEDAAEKGELENTPRPQQDEEQDEDQAHALDPELEQLMGVFLKNLKHFSYMDLLVQATHDKKIPPATSSLQQRSQPPVMIGRRRNLLEHNIHHHYSVKYLEQLKKLKSIQFEDENENDDEGEEAKENSFEKGKLEALASIQEALRAYLYQTPNDASTKANPQRQQHNAATSNSLGLPPFPPSARRTNAQLLRNMFYHSYNAYMKHAFPAAELLPLTCQPGTFDLVRLPALTLIDALDTLLVLADGLEFAKSVERLRQFHEKHKKHDGTGGIFAVNQNVSVFETTIRVLGGLLSAHQMAIAYMKSTNVGEEESTLQLPPVFLKDVYSSNSRKEEEYLQTPETVRQILEHHEKYQHHHAAAATAAAGGAEHLPDGTCTVGAAATPENPPLVHKGDDSNSHDWKEHCGAGVLALEDCAAARSKNKQQQQQQFVNQTITAQQAQRRLKLQEPQWEYDGFLLELAIDIGERLMPAFETRTGIPYGTVNLLSGVPSGETTIASLAGGGTLSLEFELLSRLTGNVRFGQAAKLAIRALWMRRSSLHLVGKHIDIQRGTWTESLSGIGSNSDSFLEYLLKHYLLFPEEEDFWIMLQSAYTGIFRDARLGEWYADVDMKTGKQAWPKGMIKRVFESLMAFYPGMQTLMGELVPASRSLNSFFMVREFLGFLPERFSYSNWKVDGGISSGAAKYLLRPELLESCYFMHRATKRENNDSKSSSSGWQWAADFALQHLDRLTRAKCGYASVRGLNPATGNLYNYQRPDQIKLSNEMPSFFLSETIKYLYLTFDDENIIHKDKDRDWIFTTEAHPIHFVPTFERTQDSKKVDEEDPPQLKSTKERLRKKLKGLKFHNVYGTYKATRKTEAESSISSHYLAEELWSDNTQPRKFRNSIKDVVEETKGYEDENDKESRWHPIKLFFGEVISILDPMQRESKEHMYNEDNNLAHMSWNSLGLGNGYGMRKACPNVFAPEMSWIHALSGGAVDYTDIYVSAFSETESDYPSSESLALLVTSAEALSVHGSGVFLGNMESAVSIGDKCEIANHVTKTNTESTAQSSEHPPQEQSEDAEQAAMSLVQQVELAGVGSFEISAFPEGSGFFMRHTDSGESIMATFIMEGNGISVEDVTLMVYASMPRAKVSPGPAASASVVDEDYNLDNNEGTGEVDDEGEGEEKEKEGPKSPWKLVGPKLASFFKKRRSTSDDENLVVEMGDPKRKVVIADLNSNAFHCEVSIVRRRLSREQEEIFEENDDTTLHEESLHDVVVGSYPCAPALFGPTHMSKLLATGGAFVEQTILAPTDDDEFGCGSDDDSDSDEDNDIPTVTPVSDEAPQEDGKRENTLAEGERTATIENSCENKTIQIVQRGHCSFYSKAANQRKNANAEGVIVVNNEEDELFIMSHGEEEMGMDEEELPVTVLVTGLDGEDMLELIEEQTLNANGDGEIESYLLAQISVLKQEHATDTEGSFKVEGDSIEWPIVRGSEEALQIFAEGGWGIHAMRRDGGSVRDVAGSNDLQLFLLRHSD